VAGPWRVALRIACRAAVRAGGRGLVAVPPSRMAALGSWAQPGSVIAHPTRPLTVWEAGQAALADRALFPADGKNLAGGTSVDGMAGPTAAVPDRMKDFEPAGREG
jgi:hypothetical protein